jgi:hypothetical protein
MKTDKKKENNKRLENIEIVSKRERERERGVAEKGRVRVCVFVRE